MNREKVEQANNIIKILDDLKSCKDMEDGRNHFRFYDDNEPDFNFIIIPKELNCKFLKLIDESIVEYEQKLAKL